MYEGGDRKIVKLFPAYLMNPVNRETFHPRNFCRLRYVDKQMSYSIASLVGFIFADYQIKLPYKGVQGKFKVVPLLKSVCTP